MKKIFTFIAAVASVALVASCEKEFEPNKSSAPAEENTITLVVDAGIEAVEEEPAQSETRTVIAGSSIKWSSSGEKLTVYEKATKDGSPSMVYKTSNAGTSTDSYVTMTFTASMNERTADNFVYYASYPSSAWVSTNSTQAKANIETSFVQTQPSTTSFDPAADLLIAKSKDNGASQATSLSMQFARVVAIGKMTIKNLPVDENVTKVTFSANNGSAVTLAGRTNFDLDTAEPVTSYGDALAKTSISVITSGLSAKATSSMDVFFTCYPFELTTGNTFTVVVEAGAYQVSRTVTIPSARELSFEAGKVSRFSVDMSTGDVSMQQPWVLYSGAFTAGDYLLVTNGKAMNNSISSDRFGYTSVAAVDNEIFTNDTDIIWRAAASSTYWTLYNPDVDMYAASTGVASKAQLLGSDADDKKLWTVSGSSTYDFVNKYNTANSVKAYLRWNGSNGFACYASGTGLTLYKKDSRPYLSTPASVTAAVNGSDDSIIDVTFSTVANAVTYVIVASPSAGDNVVKEGVTSSPATIAVSDGLEYNTTYSISVYAVPSDPASYRSSLSKKASGTVTTGDWPAASYGDALWSESFTGLSDGTSPTAGTTTLYGGGKATYAYNPSRSTIYTKVYTSSGPGTGNNLLISYSSRNDHYWAVTGIPTSGWDAFTLTYKANGTLNITGTSGVSIVDISASDNVYVKKVTVTGSPASFGITFTNPAASSNVRIDDVVLSAGAPIPGITVATSAATATATVAGTTATLNGSLTLVNGAANSSVTSAGFYYKVYGSGDAYTKVTCASAPTSTTTFSYNLTELTTGTTYTYYAWAVYDSGSEVTGESSERTFTPTQSDGSTTVAVTISTYASSNSWSTGTQYTSVSVDGNITASKQGSGSNSGKYYTTSPAGWRYYQSENSTCTFVISASGGHTIESVTVDYNSKNDGTLVHSSSNIASGTKVTVNASSISFTVGKTSDGTGAQVAISKITVKYN